MISWENVLLFLSGIVVPILVAIINKKLEAKKLSKNDKEKSDLDIKKETQKEYDKNIKTMKPSFLPSQYPTMANQIYEGMKYCIGDDYGSVRDNLMKLKNDLDVNLLAKAFGTRQGYCFGIPAGDTKDLFTFVKSELGSEYGGLTSYKLDAVNKDWAKKGIKYRF